MSTEAWRVKYDGPCAKCGTVLRAGTVAVWDRRARKMSCVECPEAPEDRVALHSEVEADSSLSIDIGVAGGSARRTYERLQDRRESDVKGRWGDRVGGWVLRFSDEPQSIRAWGIGAQGEEELAAAFEGIESLRVLNDRCVMATRGNIDHILVAPAGVFVVDAKNYAGVVEVKDVGGLFRTQLRLYVGGRDRSRLADGLGWQLTAVRAALAAADIHPLPPVTPVLCFIGSRWPRFRRPTEFEGVRLETPDSLKQLLLEPAILDDQAMDEVARKLSAALPAK